MACEAHRNERSYIIHVARNLQVQLIMTILVMESCNLCIYGQGNSGLILVHRCADRGGGRYGSAEGGGDDFSLDSRDGRAAQGGGAPRDSS